MRRLAAGLLAAFLGGCVSVPSHQERQARADALAAPAHWREEVLETGSSRWASWAPEPLRAVDNLWIYIEGDGLAYLSPRQASSDPTPVDPVGLALALAQPAGEAVYLARPCQYVRDASCTERAWTDARFSAAHVAALDSAVSMLKARAHARRVSLVGYSGGGAMAALLAARRDDVALLVTVAGNLAVKRWVASAGLSPLRDSLDPEDERAGFAALLQWHFVGSKDLVVPPDLIAGVIAGFPQAHVVHVEDADHRCCWVALWPKLWQAMGQGAGTEFAGDIH